jgi:hypothetical protein
MPGGTDVYSFPYPLPGEVFERQHIQDLAEAAHFTLAAMETDRLATLERPCGMLGSTLANTFTSDATGYMSWNIDHLDRWWYGGRSITSTQGPTLPTGLYMFTFHALRSAISAAESSYAWVAVEFEWGSGNRTVRRTHTPGQYAIRLAAPVRIPAGAAQQVRVRILVNGTVAASTMSFARNLSESAPRLGWSLIANG